MIDPQTWSSW